MKTQKKISQTWFTKIFIFVPLTITLLLWLIAPTVQPRFSSVATSMSNIGQVLGLFGLVLFALNLILSTRIPKLEQYFNGLNHLYEKHSQLGQIALVLLLFHPLLLLPKYASNIREAAAFLWLSSNWATNWGIIALGAMILLIVLTIYLRPKYNIWRFTHKFMGGAFFLAGLHVLLIPSDTSRFIPLKIYLLTLVGLGLLSFLYKTIFGKYLIRQYPYQVTSVNSLNNNVYEIKLKPIQEKLVFKPGQFAFVRFPKNPIGQEAHPFSFTSSPTENNLGFSVKMLGDYTAKINSVQPEDVANIEGPFGVFSFLNATRKKQIWIAGGIGITPFVSMAKSLHLYPDFSVELFYSVKNETDAVHIDTLENIAQTLPKSFKIFLFNSEKNGHINVKYIQSQLGSLDDKDLLICGPNQMIDALTNQLIATGINQSHIYTEKFNF